MGRSEATGDRLEEAKHINRSLSALGDVMAALAGKGRSHVPFRNSKLTQLLQDSLCGQAKAMMFIHIAPEVHPLLLLLLLLMVKMRGQVGCQRDLATSRRGGLTPNLHALAFDARPCMHSSRLYLLRCESAAMPMGASSKLHRCWLA